MDEQAASAPKRILIRPLPAILGLIAGTGLAILLQQYAVAPLTPGLLIACAIGGAVVLGFALPTLILNIMMAREPGVEA